MKTSLLYVWIVKIPFDKHWDTIQYFSNIFEFINTRSTERVHNCFANKTLALTLTKSSATMTIICGRFLALATVTKTMAANHHHINATLGVIT